MEKAAAARLTAAEGRRFAFTLAPAFVAIAGLAWWRQEPRIAIALVTIGAVLAVAGVTIPRHLGPVQRGWMGMARAISKVTTPILLGIVYYGVITPMGLVRRTVGRTPLRRSMDAPTWWVSRRDTPRSDLDRQF
ncbi:MAG TPA: SxtJ family membrane protein [Gemmatimonadota bacterium]|nr:SxtJ family membrane protein [Gemmatimonadota bacterium]